jgi:hypothetical protein
MHEHGVGLTLKTWLHAHLERGILHPESRMKSPCYDKSSPSSTSSLLLVVVPAIMFFQLYTSAIHLAVHHPMGIEEDKFKTLKQPCQHWSIVWHSCSML